MFSLFRKREPESRKALREEFEEFTKALHGADEIVQIAVGHSINMANTAFIQRFKSVEEFRRRSQEEKLQYIDSLSDFERNIRPQDPQAALGFGLFKMWVGSITANDEKLASQFSEELAYFGSKGNLPGLA